MMAISLILAALLAPCCYGAKIARQRSGPHYDYLGRLKTEDGSVVDSGVHRKGGAHYDYLGRLKNPDGSVADAKKTTGAGVGVVQFKSNAAGEAPPQAISNLKKAAPKTSEKDAKSMTTGFSNTEELPTTNNPKQEVMPGPSFDNDDSNSEHPNVVDKVQDDMGSESGIFNSLMSLLFYAGLVGVIAFMYQKRSQAKDKASSAKEMLDALALEATRVMETAAGHVRHMSFHTRILQEVQGPAWQQVSSSEDDDMLANHDQYAPSTSCAEESFCYDNESYDDGSTEVPTLVVQKPPEDLLDVSPAPAPLPLDLLVNDTTAPPESSQPRTLDSLDTGGFEL